ncbi:LytR family transcriptional regulator [Streptomyces piniterrae]|uniref:LytR family transcriptional regulator n=1 Tax=Streptomyces piniterrae TaxID=2571125 RepID=A0A4U0MQ55_9ACTN|nr:LCP family protein [Streptomyces piniterrae]TJZ42893.1 LytR family transcriptional regulator [Streptomyces piniterrae]
MTDWLDGSHDRNRNGAEVGTSQARTGQIWRQGDYAYADYVPVEYIPAEPAPAAYVPAEYAPAEYVPQAPPVSSGGQMPPTSGGRTRGGGGGGEPGPGSTSRGRAPATRPSRRRRLARAAILLTTALLATSVGTYVWADTKLNREVDLTELADRAPKGKGTNYLIVGSDSRVGLSEQDKKNLHAGGSAEAGRRTDSMILLHTGAHGTTMMSLPRDSWVTLPPYIRPDTGKHYPASKNKLNAAFSLGGPDLLVRTIERNTGLHIDHYTEIGFAGFVGIVNAIGGVPMCLDRDIRDEKSGADLKKGCHTLDGRTALAFVRQRHQEAQGDLGRSQNQQKFLAALADQAATPGILLDPSKVYPTVSAGLDTLIVDKGADLRNLASLFEAMKKVTSGDGKRLNVPVASLSFPTSKGSAVKWDPLKAKKLFTELRNDQPVTFEGKK